jgi:hypothetical protein
MKDQTTRHPASQAFHDLCDDMKAMHDKKQKDYGREGDPFSNVRASEDFGIEGWVGCMVRANDKMRRLQKAAQGTTLSNEGVEDSLMDLAVYAIIGLVLWREEQLNGAEAWDATVKREMPQRGPAPFPMTEADKAESLRLQRMRAITDPNFRGRFVPQDNGEVWWVPDTEQKPKRWDMPEEAQ